MPQNKKINLRNNPLQKTVSRCLEKMARGVTARSEADSDVAGPDSPSREFKKFLTTEFSNVNENIQQVDSRLTKIEGKLDHIEPTTSERCSDLDTGIQFSG